jgi:hypothetical protein
MPLRTTTVPHVSYYSWFSLWRGPGPRRGTLVDQLRGCEDWAPEIQNKSILPMDPGISAKEKKSWFSNKPHAFFGYLLLELTIRGPLSCWQPPSLHHLSGPRSVCRSIEISPQGKVTVIEPWKPATWPTLNSIWAERIKSMCKWRIKAHF